MILSSTVIKNLATGSPKLKTKMAKTPSNVRKSDDENLDVGNFVAEKNITVKVFLKKVVGKKSKCKKFTQKI